MQRKKIVEIAVHYNSLFIWTEDGLIYKSKNININMNEIDLQRDFVKINNKTQLLPALKKL